MELVQSTGLSDNQNEVSEFDDLNDVLNDAIGLMETDNMVDGTSVASNDLMMHGNEMVLAGSEMVVGNNETINHANEAVSAPTMVQMFQSTREETANFHLEVPGFNWQAMMAMAKPNINISGGNVSLYFGNGSGGQ